MRYVREVGLYDVHPVGQIPLDQWMIIAFVEWWGTEKHTFHLLIGEATITLHHVTILIDLPVSGRAITGPSRNHTKERIHRIFGVLPPNKAIIESSVKLTWMFNTFGPRCWGCRCRALCSHLLLGTYFWLFVCRQIRKWDARDLCLSSIVYICLCNII